MNTAPLTGALRKKWEPKLGGRIRAKVVFFLRSNPLKICGHMSSEGANMICCYTIGQTPPYVPSEGVRGLKVPKIDPMHRLNVERYIASKRMSRLLKDVAS